jgi:hypothetical protein
VDRRTFNKLIAGTITAAGISKPGQTEAIPSALHLRGAQAAGEARIPLRPGGEDQWELVILDAAPPHATETGGTAVADIDGDGKTELVICANGALLWYRPSTGERGVVASGNHYGVGVAVEDIDQDGRKEIVAGILLPGTSGAPEKWILCWYKSTPDLSEWTEYQVDGDTAGHPHDILFGDLDGDGRRELIANAMYCDNPGLFAYKVPADPRKPWIKFTIQSGLSAEGTAAGDLNGDGKDEVVSGPYWYSPPKEGAFSGQLWKTHQIAPGYRELCRAALIDVNGDGRLDVVLVEDEYPDGRLAWFENRMEPGGEIRWIEHPMDGLLNFAHTLRAWQDPKSKQVQILAGEMNEGGWEAPYNWDARLIRYTAVDGGTSFTRDLIYQGEGTHEAVYFDLDSSGQDVILGHAGQVMAKAGSYTGWVQMFRPRQAQASLTEYKHQFVDREKPYTAIDIHAVDVDSDGLRDIVCGAWWYKNPGWDRHTVPGIAQIINAFDVDRDGKLELIAIKAKPNADGFYNALSSELVWLKATDLAHDKWEEHVIGTGDGDWPHGNTIAPLLPGGRLALVCGYHEHKGSPPQIFEVPDDPRKPWPKRVIADIPYGEELQAFDLDGDGNLDVVAGPYWLKNLGNGRFEPHLLIDPETLDSMGLKSISRTAIMDVNGDGRPDILFTVEDVDWNVHKSYFSLVGWLENAGNLLDRSLKVHVIDRVRSPHSISVADLDGDGKLEVIVGEHDPFKPYRSQCRLYAYKQADPKGIAWARFPIDNRFEHHDGAKAVELSPGRIAIISHGWMDSSYVHLWERVTPK